MCFLISPQALYFVCGLSVSLTKLFFKVHCSLPSKWSRATILPCLCRLFLDSASNSILQDLVPAPLYFQLYSLFPAVMLSPFPSSEQMSSVWGVQTVASSLAHLCAPQFLNQVTPTTFSMQVIYVRYARLYYSS